MRVNVHAASRLKSGKQYQIPILGSGAWQICHDQLAVFSTDPRKAHAAPCHDVSPQRNNSQSPAPPLCQVASGISDQKPASALRIRATANMRPSATPTICAVRLSLIRPRLSGSPGEAEVAAAAYLRF
jgi:hypothetical protein